MTQFVNVQNDVPVFEPAGLLLFHAKKINSDHVKHIYVESIEEAKAEFDKLNSDGPQYKGIVEIIDPEGKSSLWLEPHFIHYKASNFDDFTEIVDALGFTGHIAINR